jgi:hypothetical protein
LLNERVFFSVIPHGSHKRGGCAAQRSSCNVTFFFVSTNGQNRQVVITEPAPWCA